ncbi:MAG: terminase [Anaerolineae bacterium]
MGPQSEAYRCEADELLYGGAAGGGKSDLILGLALTVHTRSIIFRREFTNLRGLIERSREIIGNRGRYNANDHMWRLPQRVLEFGAVQYEESVNDYQGRPHDFKGFDEITHFTELQYRFLNGWKRTADPAQRVRTVCTGNPPTTAEGRWVVRYWAPWLDETYPRPAEPGELRWFAVLDGDDVEVDGPEPITHNGETILPRSRTFIPARVEDNPYYMATGYKGQLQALPEPLRSQMLAGNFNAVADDDPWQVIPTRWVQMAQERWQKTARPPVPLTTIGVDVARGGKDQTVIARRWGAWFAPLQKHAGRTTPDGGSVAALAMAAAAGTVATINVDVIGVGASAYDTLRANKLPVVAINVAAGSDALDHSHQLGFVNLRAELYWRMREALDPEKGDGLALPPDPELLADLCAPRWELRARGIQVEAKEDIVKRLGRSTDCGDAVVLALAGTGYHGKLPAPKGKPLAAGIRKAVF